MPDVTREEAFEEFKKALEYFAYAANKLNAAWDVLNRAWPDKAAGLSNGYPFHESFDDLVLNIGEWKEITEAEQGPLDWRPDA
jgi:hypothetical protein